MSDGASPSISTLAELRQRLGERSSPHYEAHLRPDGHAARAVETRLNQLRESRVGELQTRLAAAREGAAFDHTFARLSGYSRAAFNSGSEIGD